MNKLILNDGTVINNVSEVYSDGIVIIDSVDKVKEIYEKLSDDNLSEFSVKDENDNIISMWRNKKFVAILYSYGNLRIDIADVTTIEQRVNDIESSLDALLESELGE